MSPTAEILAIHPYPEAPRPCHLIEMMVRGSDGDFAIFDITQEREGLTQVNWQIPHLAVIMDAEGKEVLADAAGTCDDIDLWLGDVRVAFYFHELDPTKPLMSPFGDLALPPETELPERLNVHEYVADE